MIATARSDFALTEPNWLPKEELAILGKAAPVFIPDLDDSEVAELREGAARLSQLLSDSHPAKPIVRNLFRLSRLVGRDEDLPWPATEAEMAKQWWTHADGQNDSLIPIDVAFCIAWPNTISRRLCPTMDVQNWLAHSTA